MRSAVLVLFCVLGAGVSTVAQRDVRPTAKPAAVAAPTGKGADVSVLVVSDDQSARPCVRDPGHDVVLERDGEAIVHVHLDRDQEEPPHAEDRDAVHAGR